MYVCINDLHDVLVLRTYSVCLGTVRYAQPLKPVSLAPSEVFLFNSVRYLTVCSCLVALQFRHVTEN